VLVEGRASDIGGAQYVADVNPVEFPGQGQVGERGLDRVLCPADAPVVPVAAIGHWPGIVRNRTFPPDRSPTARARDVITHFGPSSTNERGEMNSLTCRTLAFLGAGALCLVATGSAAQEVSAPETLDMREADASWVNDPHVHEFYLATVEAFANGPERVDRAAYEERSREIFRALAVSRDMAPEPFLQHLAAIPGEMILIVTREPETLDSVDSFAVALFGPQP
jgi:hypothetical protein